MKIKVNKSMDFAGLQSISVENNMSPLTIEANSTNNVQFSGELYISDQEKDFSFEDYMQAEFEDGKLEITLDDIDFLDRHGKNSSLKLLVPADVFLQMDIENLPLSISGLKNKIRLKSENAPVSIKNCTGDKHLENENGPIRILSSEGNIYAKLENGPLSAEDITGEGLQVLSENGPIKVRQASFKKVEIKTENGPIYYETQPVEAGDYNFETENGIVHLALPLSFSFTLEAESERGRLNSKLDAEVSRDDNKFRIETLYDDEEPTKIKIVTENGLIKLSSDSQLNISYIKEKLEQIKATLVNVNTAEELDKAIAKLNRMMDYLHRSAKSINEEKIKNKVTEAIDKMKGMAKDIDLNETGATVIGKVEGLSSEIYDGIREGLKNVKAEFDDLRYEHMNTDALKEYIDKVTNSPLIKPYLSAEKKKAEKQEIAERSRLKILDMLEKGKITSEEAEKLLKAIGKE